MGRNSITGVGGLATFVAVAEARSFSDAARRLGMSAAAVSRAIVRLEARLGTKLINRTTRSVSLTYEGERFYGRCQRIVTELIEAEAELTRGAVRPSGRLRAQLPVGFGCKVAVPELASWATAYPELSIDLDLSDRVVDLAEEGVDVAIRMGAVGDSRLVARKLTDIRYYICGSPGYLARHGTPSTPADLKHHNCMAYVIPQTGRYHEWKFGHTDNRQWSEIVSGTMNLNNAQALVECAIRGDGLVRVAEFMVADALRAGTLCPVLTGYMAPPTAMHVVYPYNRHLSSRVQAFVEFMSDLVPKYTVQEPYCISMPMASMIVPKHS